MDREPEAGYSSWFNIPQVLQLWEQQEIGPKAGGTVLTWRIGKSGHGKCLPQVNLWALVSKTCAHI